MSDLPLALDDIVDAQSRISPFCVRTPLLEVPLVNKLLKGRLLVKAEALQRTGSFKLRGAVNRLSKLTTLERERGVLAYSSGNHAQAVAYAAKHFEIRAVIVMPSDAPETKIRATQAYGAEVVLYERNQEDRAALGAKLAKERSLVVVPPFDDASVIAGQGTLGVEIIEQAEEVDARIDTLLICCSGGGLAAGCGVAFAALSPATEIYAVEPNGFEDTLQSLDAGHRVSIDTANKSICDAVLAHSPGEMTFPINQRHLSGALTVSDSEALRAVGCAAMDYKVVTEPGGAIALAAALEGRVQIAGKIVCVVLTGGNLEPSVLARSIGTVERRPS